MQGIIEFASKTMLVYIAPAVLLLGGITFADKIIQTLIDFSRAASRSFK